MKSEFISVRLLEYYLDTQSLLLGSFGDAYKEQTRQFDHLKRMILAMPREEFDLKQSTNAEKQEEIS